MKSTLSILMVFFLSVSMGLGAQEQSNELPDLEALGLNEESTNKKLENQPKTSKTQKQTDRKKTRARKKPTETKKETDSLVNEDRVSSSVLAKTNRILDQMKKSDPRGENYFNIRLGATQILSNTSGLETSPNKTLLTMGFDFNSRLFDNLYIEARYAKHTNTIAPTTLSSDDSVSLSNLYQSSTDVGIKYRVILDETKPSNYLGFKLLAHNTTNNFILADSGAAIVINKYDGWVLGVEKGIPITSNLGIDASLDMININKVQESSEFTVSNTGVGFVVRGEVYYTFELGGQRLRAAMAYWQSGMVNEFDEDDKELFDIPRQNQVQTYRMISGSLGYVF